MTQVKSTRSIQTQAAAHTFAQRLAIVKKLRDAGIHFPLNKGWTTHDVGYATFETISLQALIDAIKAVEHD